MFDFSLTELLLIFVVALVVFGPKKLPEIGSAIGRGLGEFRRALQEVKDQVSSEGGPLDELHPATMKKPENKNTEAVSPENHYLSETPAVDAHDSDIKEQHDTSHKDQA